MNKLHKKHKTRVACSAIRLRLIRCARKFSELTVNMLSHLLIVKTAQNKVCKYL